MNNNHVYDMLVVGGGPGGYTAALYAARAGLDTIVLEKLSAGGQMALTEQIDNYPGFENGIDGFSLAEKMQKQAERFGARSEYAEVLRMDLTAVPKLVETSEGIFRGKTVVLATGADPRTLGVAGETELLGRGVAYCAACDGMFYKGKTVVVVGGGNSAAADGAFAVMWGLNGWSQSMGAAPAIISLSRWYPLKERGTYYGFFSASHNLGEFFSFLFVGSIVTFAGWQAGFFGSAIAGAIGVVVILLMLHDTPESKGLPPVEALAHEKPAASADKSVKEIQKQVLRTPAVWILAAASAFMYISRYAINGWGVLFLQEAKGFSDVEAISVVSINALLGILGTVLSGWFSDKLFKGDRKVPALIFGVLNAAALALFFYGGNAMWVNVLSMVLFGIAIGVLICFLGGLMAVDIVPRKATGAALGVVGMTSYIAAGIQDVASGWLIDSNITVAADGVKHYDFGPVAIFWLAAAVISFLLPLLNRGKVKEF